MIRKDYSATFSSVANLGLSLQHGAVTRWSSKNHLKARVPQMGKAPKERTHEKKNEKAHRKLSLATVYSKYKIDPKLRPQRNDNRLCNNTTLQRRSGTTNSSSFRHWASRREWK